MTVIGTDRPYGAKPRIYIGTVAGPASYSTGGFTVTISELTKVSNAIAVAGGGYVAEVVSISGNAITVKVYSGAGTEVGDGTDLSGVTFTILAVGE